MKRLFAFIITALALSQNVFAVGIGLTNPVILQSVAVIAGPLSAHKPGNIEVQIQGGFALPAGVSCDTNYITTLKVVDPDGTMLSLLRDARNSREPVSLWITDSPNFTALPGRCSIVAVIR
jgi:hypothetical protein